MALFSKLSEYVKLPAFLQFVGYMGIAGALLVVNGWFGKTIGFISLGVSLAGFLYAKLYLSDEAAQAS